MGFVWFIQSQWPPPVVPSHLPMSSLHRPCHLERLLLSSHGNALQAPLPNHKVHQTSSTKLWTPGFQENVFVLGILSFKRSIFFSLNQRIQVSLIQNPCFNYVSTMCWQLFHWNNPFTFIQLSHFSLFGSGQESINTVCGALAKSVFCGAAGASPVPPFPLVAGSSWRPWISNNCSNQEASKASSSRTLDKQGEKNHGY